MQIKWLNEDPRISLKHGRSLRRRINSLLISLQIKLRTSRVRGYPRHLILDLVNVCGLKCPICPQGRNEIKRKSQQITPQLFRDIMDTLGPYLYTLTLTNWGEPLLHRKILDLLKYARNYPCYIGFSTNLQFLPDDLAEQLIHSGLDEIGCSIDGATEETYLKYRIGGDFEKAVENLRKLVRLRNDEGQETPKIRWQVLLNRYTEKEIDLIRSMAEDIGVDHLMFLPIFIDIARMFTHSPRERIERDADWLPLDKSLSWYDYETGKLKNAPDFCSKLWDTAVIHPDGALSPCCAVIDPKDDFGYFSKGRGFKTVWNNKKYVAARQRISGQTQNTEPVVCGHCAEKGILIF